MIATNIIQQIKSVPIYEVVSHYLKLKKKGTEYLGLCPFHDERTPSFFVHPAKQLYKCFGCGKSGDAIKFIMIHENKTFIEAVEIIAGIAGIHIEYQKATKKYSQVDSIINKAFQTKHNTIVDYDTIASVIIPNTFSHDNPLIASLIEVFEEEVVTKVCKDYHISTNGNWIIYPQFDYNSKLRTGQKILYDDTGKRNKNSKPVWIHYEYKQQSLFTLNQQQCLYGEHLLLRYPTLKVAITESCSTMLFMACMAQVAQAAHYLWLSTGGATSMPINSSTMSALKSRIVKLYPDAGFYQAWQSMADVMQGYGVYAGVDKFVEEKYEGGMVSYNDDLRDYFRVYGEEPNCFENWLFDQWIRQNPQGGLFRHGDIHLLVAVARI